VAAVSKIQSKATARGVYWVALCLAALLLYATDNPVRNSLPIGFTTYGQEIEFNREYYATLLGEYRAKAADLEWELEATKAEACLKYEIEAFCFHHDVDMRDKWGRWYDGDDK
jgi:hypothetical protein